eukprot:766515-Hanusia_phi.AAC.4
MLAIGFRVGRELLLPSCSRSQLVIARQGRQDLARQTPAARAAGCRPARLSSLRGRLGRRC